MLGARPSGPNLDKSNFTMLLNGEGEEDKPKKQTKNLT